VWKFIYINFILIYYYFLKVQGFESKLFLSYFKQLVIMDGGIDSGFNIVKPIEYKPQLFHIRYCEKTLTCTSVPVTRDSLNNGDVFVLDKGLNIYQWNGNKANGVEKYKAMEFTSSLKSERFGKPKVVVYSKNLKKNYDNINIMHYNELYMIH